jgi:NAD(P)-dependent dehydrogenase (short-subunit alcohol dehydrogenase family)
LLTHLLIDRLKASAPARVVNVASNVATVINFENLQQEQHFRMMKAYGQSKMGNIYFTNELAKRLEGTGVTANSLHPGVVATNFTRNYGPVVQFITRLLFISPDKGAQTSIYLASSPEVEGVSGKYFAKRRLAEPPKGANDEASAQRLWKISEKLTKLGTAEDTMA